MEVSDYTFHTEDFKRMGWSSARIYNMSFVKSDFSVSFDIDYVLSGLDTGGPFYVVPSDLVFINVSKYKISYEFSGGTPEQIRNIDMSISGRTPNNKLNIYMFNIETDSGIINISSTGFIQVAKAGPVLSGAIDLGR